MDGECRQAGRKGQGAGEGGEAWKGEGHTEARLEGGNEVKRLLKLSAKDKGQNKDILRFEKRI